MKRFACKERTRGRTAGILAGMVCVLAVAAQAALAEAPRLRVYLPREITASQQTLTLGQVALLHCPSEKIADTAGQIPMGRPPRPGEKLVLDRTDVLSRLASHGVPAERVDFSGADKVTVQLDAQVLPEQRLTGPAEKLLAAQHRGAEGVRWALARAVEPVVVAGQEEVNVTAVLAPDNTAQRRRVVVTISREGKELAQRELIYQPSYRTWGRVAGEAISRGTLLSDRNSRLQADWADRPDGADPNALLGQIARVEIAPGTTITEAMVAAPTPEIVVRRNQTVVMRLEGDGFTIQAPCLVLQDGHVGQAIKVRNCDTQRTITAQVMPDGTVQPVMGT